MNLEHLRTYLQDHMAGAVALIDMAERSRDNSDDPGPRATFTELIDEIEYDRQQLERLLEAVGGERSAIKEFGSKTMERLARFKPAGGVGGQGPMSRLLEFELMLLGVRGKKLLWERMIDFESLDGDGLFAPFDFENLKRRADEQLARLDDLHRQAACTVIAEPDDA